MEEIKEDTSKWKDILSSWIGKISIVEMFILPSYSLQSIKIPMNF